jgi:hypothetical protein
MSRPISQEAISQKTDIAQMMADGCPSIRQAGERLGINRSQADRLWKRICADLGWQAA